MLYFMKNQLQQMDNVVDVNCTGLLLGHLAKPSNCSKYCTFSDGSARIQCTVIQNNRDCTLDVMRPPEDLLCVKDWRLVPCRFRESECADEPFLLIISSSGLKTAESLRTLHSFHIFSSVLENLPKLEPKSKQLFGFQRSSFVPGPNKNILATTTVKVIAKSILIMGKASKGFMIQVECHYPSKLEIDVSFQFVAYILFTQESNSKSF